MLFASCFHRHPDRGSSDPTGERDRLHGPCGDATSSTSRFGCASVQERPLKEGAKLRRAAQGVTVNDPFMSMGSTSQW